MSSLQDAFDRAQQTGGNEHFEIIGSIGSAMTAIASVHQQPLEEVETNGNILTAKMKDGGRVTITVSPIPVTDPD